MGYTLIKIVPLHVCYMVRPVFRPSLSTAVQNSYKGRNNKRMA